MSHQLHRRQLLRMGGVGLLAGAFSSVLNRTAYAQVIGQPVLINFRKVLIIFQRGANCGLNTIIPHGNSSEYFGYRPLPTLSGPGVDNIGVPFDPAFDLNGFASMHPAMAPLSHVFNQGHLAFLHRVGTIDYSRSHFEAQRYYETLSPTTPAGSLALEEGWVARMVGALPTTGGYAGVSVSNAFQQAFRSTDPSRVQWHVPNIAAYSQAKVKGAPTAVEAKMFGSAGLAAQYGGAQVVTETSALAYRSGVEMQEADAALSGVSSAQPNTPYPATPFGASLRDAVSMLTQTNALVAGVEIGGWDTHAFQGGVNGRQAELLNELALGLRAVYNNVMAHGGSQDLMVLVVTEFGRTTPQTGSFGTDHGHGGVAMAMGLRVNGGVYNCDPSTWLPGDMTGPDGPWVHHRTDFRAVFKEILRAYYFANTSMIDLVIPGWSSLSGPTFAELGFVKP